MDTTEIVYTKTVAGLVQITEINNVASIAEIAEEFGDDVCNGYAATLPHYCNCNGGIYLCTNPAVPTQLHVGDIISLAHLRRIEAALTRARHNLRKIRIQKERNNLDNNHIFII